MKKWKNKLDEMQEQKMLRIEHNGCWLAFWGLVIAIIAQIMYYGPDCSEEIIGEFIVFMCLACYIAIGCVINGIWDRKLAPSWKVNLCTSLIAGVVGGAIRFIISYREYQMAAAGAAVGFLVGIYTFAGCFILLSIALFIYKWRENRLENETEDEKKDK